MNFYEEPIEVMSKHPRELAYREVKSYMYTTDGEQANNKTLGFLLKLVGLNRFHKHQKPKDKF
jgi:hypothetical protein